MQFSVVLLKLVMSEQPTQTRTDAKAGIWETLTQDFQCRTFCLTPNRASVVKGRTAKMMAFH